MKKLPSNCVSTLISDLAHAKHYTDNLLIDENLSGVYQGQTEMIGPYLKPVFAILFRQQGDELKACLIDTQDLKELSGLIRNTTFPEGTNIWISTTQHQALEGKLPENIQQYPEYFSLIEQVRFF